MRITTTLAAAASIAVLSTSAFAGGMSDEVMEAPVVAMEEVMEKPAGSGMAGIIVLAVLAAAAIFAATEE
jgi:hypothetical protein